MDFAFSSFSEFMMMGKHGLYVWLCYGLTAFIIFSNIAIYRFRKAQILEGLKKDILRKQKQQQNYQEVNTP